MDRVTPLAGLIPPSAVTDAVHCTGYEQFVPAQRCYQNHGKQVMGTQDTGWPKIGNTDPICKFVCPMLE